MNKTKSEISFEEEDLLNTVNSSNTLKNPTILTLMKYGISVKLETTDVLGAAKKDNFLSWRGLTCPARTHFCSKTNFPPRELLLS